MNKTFYTGPYPKDPIKINLIKLAIRDFERAMQQLRINIEFYYSTVEINKLSKRVGRPCLVFSE